MAQLNLCGPRDFLLQLEEVNLEELRMGWVVKKGHQKISGGQIFFMEKTGDRFQHLLGRIFVLHLFPSNQPSKIHGKRTAKASEHCWELEDDRLRAFWGPFPFFSGANPSFEAFALFSIFGF